MVWGDEEAMFNRVLSLFGVRNLTSQGDETSTRRKHVRHEAVHAEVVVGDHSYNIRDWGMGGVFFETTPEVKLNAGDKIPAILRFRFPHETIVIQHPARVIRTARRGGTAAEFAPLPAQVRRQFQRVLDNLHTQRFLESQIA